MVDLNSPAYIFGIEIECLLGVTKQVKTRQARRDQCLLIKESMDRSLRVAASTEKVTVHGGTSGTEETYDS